MTFLPDTNACITLLRQKDPRLVARWRATRASDLVLCSIVVYELRHGAERSSNPAKEHVSSICSFNSLHRSHSTIRALEDVREFLA